jgi:NAD(P)H-flavin reductase
MAPRFLEVRRVIRETRDTVTLALADSEARPPFTPGQFNMLYAFGVGEAAVSISGDPGDPGVLIHTVRAVGTVTRPLASVKRGEMIGVRGPFGRGWPADAAARRAGTMLLLAGGIGLAPLRPVVYDFLRNRAASSRLVLLYGARTPADLLYKRELERWRNEGGIDLHVIVDRGDASWRGRVGVLTDLLDSCRFEPADTIAMVCGPEVMMRIAAHALANRGIAEDDIHLSMERNMKCAIGACGHCQFGPSFVCKDGPVFALPRIAALLATREI